MHDVIVLGNSLTALAAAALLSQQGFYVLQIGDGRRYEEAACFPLYHQDADRGVLGLLLQQLGLTVKRQPLTVIDRVFFPEHHLTRTRSLGDFKTDLIALFPEAKEALNHYFTVIEGLGREWLGLLEGRLKMVPTDIPYCMKFFGVTHAQFVHQHFADHPQLAGLLNSALPEPDVALTVMAGYLYGQVLDACQLQGGLPEVRRLLESYFVDKGGTMLVTPCPIELLYEDENVVGATVAGISHRSRFVLDVRGDTESAPPKSSTLSFLSIALELDAALEGLPETEVWYDYASYDVVGSLQQAKSGVAEADLPLMMWNPLARAGLVEDDRKRLRIDIPLRALGSDADYKALGLRALQRAETRIPGLTAHLRGYEVMTPEQHELASGFTGGAGTRWAFSVAQVLRNPVALKNRNGLFSLADWGFAWFSAASVAVNAIVPHLTANSQPVK
jgi:phytoene dehydrogenase-like protein